jgi:hypothetical protein
MDFFDFLSYFCWIVSIILFLYLLIDFFKVNKEYDEEFLLSSREAADEIVMEERKLAEEREARAEGTET